MLISSGRPVRIGAVNYLNSKPLVEGLTELLPAAELILDYPSRLADELSAGRLDVALIPSIECFRNPQYRIISNACVAACGPVLSVKLYSRVPIGNIRRLSLDEGSRTSAALVRVILAEQYGVEPETEPLPIGHSIAETTADAVLLIGDRAICPPDESFVVTWDLGEKWQEWTGLPFVFALWVTSGKEGVTSGNGDGTSQNGAAENHFAEIADGLNRARDLGVQRIPEIARREAAILNIDEITARNYLTNNLHFQIGSAERNGLKLFQNLTRQLHLIQKDADLVFLDNVTA